MRPTPFSPAQRVTPTPAGLGMSGGICYNSWMTDRRIALALLVLPLAVWGVLTLMLNASLPLWQVFNLDPDYYYLLNGLLIAQGLPPADVFHPGTPIQVLFALVLRAMNPGLSGDGLVNAVLADPERPLLVVARIVHPMVALSVWWVGRQAGRTFGRLLPALLAQSAPFLSMIILKFALHPKPEAFLIIAVNLLIGACLIRMRQPGSSPRQAGWIGAAVGFAVAIKLHCFLLGLVPLFLIDRRHWAAYGAAAAVVFLLAVSPAWPSTPMFIHWFSAMALHSGAYGAGAATVVDTHHYPRAVLALFGSKLVFTAALLAGIAVLAGYARKRRRGLVAADPAARLLAGLILAQVAFVLLIAKQSAAHYMTPAVMLSGITLAIVWRLTGGRVRVWGVLAAVLLVLQAKAAVVQTRELTRWTRETAAIDMSRFDACTKVWFDSASSKTFALARGDMMANFSFTPRLAAIQPQDEYVLFLYQHPYGGPGLRRWDRAVELDEVLNRAPCVVFRGNSGSALQVWMAERRPGWSFDQSCEVGEENILTKGTTCR